MPSDGSATPPPSPPVGADTPEILPSSPLPLPKPVFRCSPALRFPCLLSAGAIPGSSASIMGSTILGTWSSRLLMPLKPEDPWLGMARRVPLLSVMIFPPFCCPLFRLRSTCRSSASSSTAAASTRFSPSLAYRFFSTSSLSSGLSWSIVMPVPPSAALSSPPSTSNLGTSSARRPLLAFMKAIFLAEVLSTSLTTSFLLRFLPPPPPPPPLPPRPPELAWAWCRRASWELCPGCCPGPPPFPGLGSAGPPSAFSEPRVRSCDSAARALAAATTRLTAPNWLLPCPRLPGDCRAPPGGESCGRLGSAPSPPLPAALPPAALELCPRGEAPAGGTPLH
mmetsp:Transcript_3980/g.11241  ORF Transcript_3980/g.11241 Transcript_3980/m.11241 type:complete len:337 (-) Transcript_3980:333-1343(-)